MQAKWLTIPLLPWQKPSVIFRINLAVVETKQDEFEQERSQAGDDDKLSKQVKDIKAIPTHSHGHIFLDLEEIITVP